jgi:beta-alanine--pyruvate transaminase
MAKAITNAAVPMGAVAARKHIYDAMMEGADAPVELFHGYTYSGHPLACAAGLATLDVYRDEGLFERAARMAPIFEDALHSLKGARHVIDIRNAGMMGAVELEPREGAPTLRAAEAYRKAFDAGVLTRVTGDTLALSPPLVIEEAQIGQIIDTLRAVFDTVD